MPSKILLIEDEEIIRGLISDKLAKEGYDIIESADGQDGLRLMQERKPDLVIVNIGLQKMGGLAMLEEASRDSRLRQIPMIVIIDSEQSLELERAKELGAKDWLVKTEFEPQEVVDKVARQIGK